MLKWALPSSGSMKRSVVRFLSGRQHSEKADLLVLSHSFGLIFLVCHRNCKAIEVANRATLAIWCLFEYMNLIETTDIISGRSLETYCKMRLRFYVPLLYSVSYIMAL